MAEQSQLQKTLASLPHLNLSDDIADLEGIRVQYGGMCDVFTARSTRHDTKVAVKRLRVFSDVDERTAKQISREIQIWASLEHENILPLLGFILEESSRVPSLVSRWMDHGVLPVYMKKFPRANVCTCAMLGGIISGLSYLHAKNIIHGDLKGDNILISPEESPLLADFGISRLSADSQTGTGSATQFQGTARWMAKEFFLSHESGGISRCNEMTDIWAFGMVTYEMLSWNLPYSDIRGTPQVIAAIMRGDLPTKPPSAGIENSLVFESLWTLCNSCWLETSSRPSTIECSEKVFDLLKPYDWGLAMKNYVSSFAHLNLQDDIIEYYDRPPRFGDMCDVFAGWSEKHHSMVAIKRIRTSWDGHERFSKQFLKEIRIWASIECKNVLPLLGFIQSPAMIPILVSEWVNGGILPDYIRTFPRASIDTVRMGIGIASGLSYLHSKGVVHGDLKAHNILISPDKLPLLSDFGFSRMLIDSQIASGTGLPLSGTIRWMAKELLVPLDDGGVSKHNEMTDVWAFGMVIYEMLSWELPYGSIRETSAVKAAIVRGELPTKQTNDGIYSFPVFETLWALCRSCWLESSSRPSAATCLENLERGLDRNRRRWRREERAPPPAGRTTNKLGLNTTLNKLLEESVSAVSPKVIAARKSFDAVGGIVEQFSADSRDAKLLHKWKSIEKDYTVFLQESSELAIHGAKIIDDFLECVFPYLISSGDPEKKCTELRAHCETLQESENRVRMFSKTLESVAAHVIDFMGLWEQRVKVFIKEAVEELKGSIKRLESEIYDLARSIRGVNGNILKMKLAKLDKAEKLQEEEVQQHNKAEKLVSKYGNNISANTDGLRVVWNLVETHLRVAASGKSQALFKQRLAILPEQYNVLKDSLQKFSLALSMESGGSERSFFNKLRSVFH